MFYGTPPIVTNGLVLNLDCGNRLSYPTSGTTWTDLSGNNNNGTLTNGPTFNPNNLGSIVFDGVDDNVQLGLASNLILNPTGITVESWCKTNVDNQYRKLFTTVGSGTQSIAGVYFSIGPNGLFDEYFPYYLGIKTNVGTQAALYTLPISTTRYNHLLGTYNGTSINLYLNGDLVATQAQTGNIITTGIARISGYDNNSESWNGNISNFKIYNRALTSTEVLQNYNAYKTRFGLT